jgi:hypothetical protein
MGLFGNIIGGVKKVIATNPVTKAIGNSKVTQGFTTIVQHPIQSVTSIGKSPSSSQSFSNVVKKTINEPLGGQIINVVKTTVTTGAAIVGGAAIGTARLAAGGTALLKGAGNTIASNPIKSAIIAPVLTGAIINNPVGVVKTGAKTSEALLDFGTLISNPTTSNIKNFVTEHPVATGVGGAAALFVGAKTLPSGLAYLIGKDSGAPQQSKLPADYKKTLYDSKVSPVPTPIPIPPIIKEKIPKENPINSETPTIVTPTPTAAVPLSAAPTPIKKAKKKRKKKKKAKKKTYKKKKKKKTYKKKKRKTIKRRKPKKKHGRKR